MTDSFRDNKIIINNIHKNLLEGRDQETIIKMMIIHNFII